MPAVFAFASPENKASTGPLERFALLLQHAHYRPLLQHASAQSLQRMQTSESAYMEIVEVTPSPSEGGGGAAGVPMLFAWMLQRQPTESNWRGCWMTDSVQVIPF